MQFTRKATCSGTSCGRPPQLQHRHCRCDKFFIAETHLKARHSNQVIRIDGYQLLRRDRLTRQRGGVAVLVREGLVTSELKVPGEDDRTLELLWVSVSMNKRQNVVGSLYHPPEPIYRTEELITKIEKDVEWISREFCSSLIILAGG